MKKVLFLWVLGALTFIGCVESEKTIKYVSNEAHKTKRVNDAKLLNADEAYTITKSGNSFLFKKRAEGSHYHIYIDTDRDRNSGYNPWDEGGVGAEYLIEDGNFFYYDGAGGSDEDWELVSFGDGDADARVLFHKDIGSVFDTQIVILDWDWTWQSSSSVKHTTADGNSVVAFKEKAYVAEKVHEEAIQNKPIGASSTEATALYKGSLFASPSGNGSSCSKEKPCRITEAFSKLDAGDVLFLRGGTYILSRPLSVDSWATKDEPIIIESYPGELAILDGQNRTVSDVENWRYSSGEAAIRVLSNHVSIRNIEIKGMREKGIQLFGSHNTIEGCNIHHNFLSGIEIWDKKKRYNAPYERGYNHVINNRVHHNSDVGLYEGDFRNGNNADGITIPSGKHNIVEYNTVYANSDDGIDTWRSNDSVVRYNISYDNGRGDGDGNGFKAGGNLDRYSKNGLRTVMKHNISYNNTERGFDVNSGKHVTFEYNTAYRNGANGFTSLDNTSVKYNIAVSNAKESYVHDGHESNSWQVPHEDIYFQSTDVSSENFLKPQNDSDVKNIGAYAYL